MTHEITRRLAPLALCAAAACAAESGSAPPRAAPPDIPPGPALTGDEIRALVPGGPYRLTLFTAPITGVSAWTLGEEGEVTGTFRNSETGDAGAFAIPAFVEGDRLCTEQSAGVVCHKVHPWRDGFMEVTEAGAVHAVSVPME